MIITDIEKDFAALFPFWDKIDDSDRALITRMSSSKSYTKGELVHGASAECTGAIVVKSGCLRTYMLSENGREITLYRLFPGDMCMLSASCVIKAITFDVFVDAQEDSECTIINGKALSEITKKNPYAENFALNMAVERFSDVMWVMQQILFMSLDRRLAIFLWDETAKNGDGEIRLTHEQIARYIGSAREAVSRMLKYFSDEGLTANTRGGIIIKDRQRLKALATK